MGFRSHSTAIDRKGYFFFAVAHCADAHRFGTAAPLRQGSQRLHCRSVPAGQTLIWPAQLTATCASARAATRAKPAAARTTINDCIEINDS
jgi:hypothetical protein